MQARPRPVADGVLPKWILGTWIPSKTYEDDKVRYVFGDDPQHWYPGKALAIAPDRVSFFNRVCEKPRVTQVRGSLDPLVERRGGSFNDYGLPRETKPVSYLKLVCAQVLVDLGDGKGPQPSEDADTWTIVIRSRDAIEMPFYAASYVAFRRPGPTS